MGRTFCLWSGRTAIRMRRRRVRAARRASVPLRPASVPRIRGGAVTLSRRRDARRCTDARPPALSAASRPVFVGRARSCGSSTALFTEDPPASVLLVHGPGGTAERAAAGDPAPRAEAGWTPLTVDARDLAPVPDAVERALAGAWETERPLVLLDAYQRMSALGAYLRTTLLPSLPERAIVVVAGAARRSRAGSRAAGRPSCWRLVQVHAATGARRRRRVFRATTRRRCRDPDEHVEGRRGE